MFAWEYHGGEALSGPNGTIQNAMQYHVQSAMRITHCHRLPVLARCSCSSLWSNAAENGNWCSHREFEQIGTMRIGDAGNHRVCNARDVYLRCGRFNYMGKNLGHSDLVDFRRRKVPTLISLFWGKSGPECRGKRDSHTPPS